MRFQIGEHFFKPEVRSAGQTLYNQGKFSISKPSDTEVTALIRGITPVKVSFKTKTVSSSVIYMDCNCPSGKKNLFCKHMWALLLVCDEKYPEFLDEKTDIEKMNSETKEENFKPKPNLQTKAWEEKQAALKEKQKAYLNKQKEAQSAYRKAQYLKQKERLKNAKKNNSDTVEELRYPSEVEKALSFFSENGIELRSALKPEIIGAAKKKLARVFHPDMGGSHEEILKLNEFSEVLLKFTHR